MGKHDRPFLVTTGVMVVTMGVLLAADPTARAELFLGSFWPLWWVAAGLSCIAYAARPWSANLHAYSGAAFAIACIGRAVQLALALTLGDVPHDRQLRTMGGVLVFVVFGRLVHRQWRTLMPIRESDARG